jgi:hypothetical protein
MTPRATTYHATQEVERPVGGGASDKVTRRGALTLALMRSWSVTSSTGFFNRSELRSLGGHKDIRRLSQASSPQPACGTPTDL